MIVMNGVHVGFGGVPVLRDLSLSVKAGEFVCLVGETGIGKTTLLRLIYFDLMPEQGEVTVGNYSSASIRRSEVPILRRTLGIVFQDFRLLPDRNVFDNVAFALQVTGAPRNEIGKRVLRILADVGLSHKRNSMPDDLSGGEQQRVVIARAMVNEPAILLADEPTGNLDPVASDGILQLIRSINGRGTAVLLATHNREIIRKTGARVLELREGKLFGVPAFDRV
jgi:cell division transport system ATP-binding protein